MCSLPKPYAFVVISLEPSLSVAYLNSSDLTDACNKINTKKYVAYVGECEQDVVKPHTPYHSFVFHLVYQGLRRLKGGLVGAEVSYPILPNTTHPLSRSPLDPGRHLPWDNCYISEFVSISAVCPTVTCDTKPSSMYELSRIAGVDLECSMADECYEWRNRSVDGRSGYRCSCSGGSGRDLAEGSLPESIVDSPVDLAIGRVSEDCHSLSPGELSSGFKVHESSSSQYEKGVNVHAQRIIYECPRNMFELEEEVESDILAEEVQIPPGQVSSSRTSLISMMQDKVVVKASFDLSEVDQVNDPAEFFEEVEALWQLKQVYEMELTQREIEVARQVDDEYFAQFEKEKDTDTALMFMSGLS
ncbi:hypothetical protein L218DRAFT_933088 [Marasmius fiardii PR-910]|nr:hypothetical protein L218DRAFT_933088 [Marasmius fiardii PR-910]